jgi:predicted aspartyl protease
MAKSYTFERHTEDDLILVTAQLDNSVVDFVLDTGASHTFIDFGILIKEGYRKNDTKGIVPIETANGIIFADRYIVSKITALGITKTNFEVTSYLFDEPESDFKGVIGLDFLIDNEFCISLKKSLITIKS